MAIDEKGTISIHTENIFPIIKKFLYSDHEIFLRELVSNGVDANQKLKQLSGLGEFGGELGELQVSVTFDKEAKTITVSDRGVGMTADEVKKYINQIAFSGAQEFVEKYKDQDAQQIIGKFGLGFYSAFMVASEVEIQTLSWQDGATPVRWHSDGTTEFSISEGNRTERGTDIILHINEESEEFLEEARLRTILEKYGKFLPIPVEFKGETINNTAPIWTKAPSDLTDEDYKNFYKELYPYQPDPLFWIHLNVDYPFNLTGVLYFPKVQNDWEPNRNKIGLYSRQVFITDEVKDIVPEFLMLLHGVIDSPDIPLNVSRSFLQADSNVKKINSYITKKVAEKLTELFKEDRSEFEKKWDDISVFVRYGMVSDEKFYDRATDFALLKNTEGKYFTLEEYKTAVSTNQTDKDDNTVMLYTTDPEAQHTFVQAATRKGYDVLLMDGIIDSHFVNHLEMKLEKTQLKRVDAEAIDKLIDKGEELESTLTEAEEQRLTEVYKAVVGELNADQVKVAKLTADDAPVSVTLPEFLRRMQDMQRQGGMGMMGNMPERLEVAVNVNHPLNAKILKVRKENREKLARHAYELALLGLGKLKGSALTEFTQRSVDLLSE